MGASRTACPRPLTASPASLRRMDETNRFPSPAAPLRGLTMQAFSMPQAVQVCSARACGGHQKNTGPYGAIMLRALRWPLPSRRGSSHRAAASLSAVSHMASALRLPRAGCRHLAYYFFVPFVTK